MFGHVQYARGIWIIFSSYAFIMCVGWVHKRLSGVIGSLNSVSDFYMQCVHGNETMQSKVESNSIGSESLQCIDILCYHWDMVNSTPPSSPQHDWQGEIVEPEFREWSRQSYRQDSIATHSRRQPSMLAETSLYK